MARDWLAAPIILININDNSHEIVSDIYDGFVIIYNSWYMYLYNCWVIFMPDMRFCDLWFFCDNCLFIIFELYYYISICVIRFLLEYKAYNFNFLFPFRVMGCIALDGFEYWVWVMESFYRSCMIFKASLQGLCSHIIWSTQVMG